MPIGSSDLRRLVGRADEVELLASLLDGARNAGSALVIKGEPGVRKSRLLSEAAVLARERGFSVLTTTGVQSIEGPPTQSAAASKQELTLTFDELALIYKSLQAVKTLGALPSEDELLHDTIQLVDQALNDAIR